MKESVRSLKSSEVCAVEYCTATSSFVVVDMGASSVPPCCMKLSVTSVSRMPRQRSRRVSYLPSCVSSCAPTARNLPMASRRKAMVTGKGWGSVRSRSRSGLLSTL